MTLADLPVSHFEEVAEEFLPQTREDMCYSAGLVNIINELGNRKKGGMRFSLARMNTVCGYRHGHHCQEDIVPTRVNELLEPHGFRLRSVQGEGVELDFLRSLTTDERSSFPLVNVSSAYFEFIGVRHRGAYQWDHVLVVMGVDHDIIYVYDPYSTFYSRYPSVHNPPTTLTIPDFLRVWEQAKERRWACWVEPLGYKQLRLTELGGR